MLYSKELVRYQSIICKILIVLFNAPIANLYIFVVLTLGVSSGSFICGWLMDTYGGVIAFRTFSVGAILWLSGFWLMELLLRKLKTYPLRQGHNRE